MSVIGVHGTADDRPDDPFWLIPAAPLDIAVVAAPVSQPAREDLQVWGFLTAAASRGRLSHPVVVDVGSDPPDRVVRFPDGQWRLELTELTAPDVRQELALVRRFGRRLEQRLAERQDVYAHLVGRHIALGYLGVNQTLPRDEAQAVEDIATALRDDHGYVGQDVDVSEGFPEVWPNGNGFYGQHSAFTVQVYPDGRPGVVTVSATAQAHMFRSEALDLIRARIQSKDVPQNDMLLFTAGLPDGRGQVCGLDAFIFRHAFDDLRLNGWAIATPQYLRSVFFHLYGTVEWFSLDFDHREGSGLLIPPQAPIDR